MRNRVKTKETRVRCSSSLPKEYPSQREIYLDIKEKCTLPKPNPIRTAVNRRDKRLWCEYYHNCGHTTRDYRELKRVLDKLADEGKLNQYLKDPKEKKKDPGNEKEFRSDETIGFVNVIAGGYGSGGLTNRSRKKHFYTLKHGTDVASTTACPTMTFKDSYRLIQTLPITPWSWR